MEKISEKIRKGRLLMGLGQEELAKKLGVTKNTVWLWEDDRKIPRGDVLLKAIELLDCVHFFSQIMREKILLSIIK